MRPTGAASVESVPLGFQAPVTRGRRAAINRQPGCSKVHQPKTSSGNNTMKWLFGIALGIMMSHWTTAALPGDALEIEDAYARSVPPGQSNSAVFMHIINRGAAAKALVGGQSDAAGVVELHSHAVEDGMMRMRRIQRIEVPGNGAVSLEPGGMHVMLIGLKRGLTPGDTVNLTLDLDDGTTIDVKAPVRAVQVMDHHPQ